MRFYFRIAKGIGVSMPWWMAAVVWLLWLYGLVIVAAVWLAFQLIRLLVVGVAALVESRQNKRLGARPADGGRLALPAVKEQPRVMGEVSHYSVGEDAIRFTVNDWVADRVAQISVPLDRADPDFVASLERLHDGAVVLTEVPKEGGERAVDFRFIWNSDGSPGPDNDGSPGMAPYSLGEPGYFGFRSWRYRIDQAQRLEEAKRTGHLLLDDGEVNAWHGVTPSGQQCHHRHRTPQAAAQCAARLQHQEGG